MLTFLVHYFNITYMCNLFRNAFNMRNLLRDAFNIRNLLRDAFNMRNLLHNAFNEKSFQLKIPIKETRNMKLLKFIQKITKFQTKLKKNFKNIVFLFFSYGTHDRSFFCATLHHRFLFKSHCKPFFKSFFTWHFIIDFLSHDITS